MNDLDHIMLNQLTMMRMLLAIAPSGVPIDYYNELQICIQLMRRKLEPSDETQSA